MAKKKKDLRRQSKEKKKREIENIVRKGKCLKCKKPMIKHHNSCKACLRKTRLERKANKRGKPKKYYTDSE